MLKKTRRVYQPLSIIALAVFATSAATAAPPSLEPLSDSVVDDQALVMGSAAKWGRAINGLAFQVAPLLTYNGYQYVAWYRHDDDLSAMIARRRVTGEQVGQWEIVDTGSSLDHGDDTWNCHNIISIGISPSDGRIHMSWDQHASSLRYRATRPGVAKGATDTWSESMFGPEQRYLTKPGDVPQITYPTFVNAPADGLQFFYRNRSSGNGDYLLTTYADGQWSMPKVIIGGRGGDYFGSPTRNGYPNGFDYGPDGTLHMTWTWRESSGGANHDINYAWSRDGGVTWHNNAGDLVADTNAGDAITLNDPGLIVVALDRKQSLYNTQGQTVDVAGRVHVVMYHRRQEPGNEWQAGDPNWNPLDSAYYHYFRDPATGEWSQRRLPLDPPVGRRPMIGHDAQNNLFAVYTTRDAEDGNHPYSTGPLVIAGASAASNYTDWTILHIEEGPPRLGFIGEPLLDPARLLHDGILSIFMQENTPISAEPTSSRLHVYEFAVTSHDHN